MFVGRRWVCWLLGVALMASSCGGGSGSTADVETINSGSDTITNVSGDPSVQRAIELAVMLVDQLGDDDSAVGALLLAGDTGYSIKQIEAAIVSATLAADGSIVGVQPARDAAGLISALSANDSSGVRIALKVNASAQGADELLPIEQMRVEAAEHAGSEDYWPVGAQATALILSWQLQGYSQEQIVNMLILGVESIYTDYDGPIAEGEENCGGLVIGGVHEIPQFCDPENGELYPDDEDTTDAEQADDEPATTSTSSVPPPPFPWTYEGTVTQHIATHTDFGAQGAIEFDNSFPVTITLNADGTVSGTVGGGSVTVALVRCTGAASNPGGEVSAGLRDIEPWQLTGTHDDGTVRFDRLSNYLPSESDVDGTYTPQEIDAYWENNVSLETCGGVGNHHYSVTESFTLVRTDPPPP